MAAGARDFLTKPPPADELYATVRRVYEIQVQTFGSVSAMPGPLGQQQKLTAIQQLGRETHIVVVYSPQGGAGKTTIATNLAAGLMREGTRVLLVDCDFQFGDIAVFLNLKPQATIIDLMPTVDELDMDLVENVLVTHDSGLRVLLAPTRPEDAELVAADKVPQLIEKLKGLFDFIIIDLPSQLDNLALALFDLAERIVLVVNPTLPSIKNTLSVMTLLDSLEYSEEKRYLVINRVTAELERSRVAIGVASIEQKLKRPVLGVIPMDERKVLYAVNRGISVIAKDKNQSPAKELLALAEALRASLAPPEEAPVQPAQTKGPDSRFRRLFGN
jgi:pilus assembly protein CpaE